ncbi:MAG TPA: hypothetical protein VHX67_07365 [Acidimicrobiales bacterium]|nr:hypothetical protein [Acidimicrobiales bacterium]
MTTRTEHGTITKHGTITRERIGEVLAEKSEERTDVPAPETEPGRKPLVAFDALPARTAPPLTWD